MCHAVLYRVSDRIRNDLREMRILLLGPGDDRLNDKGICERFPAITPHAAGDKDTPLHEAHLCELNDEPHEKGRGDENHQPAHPFRRPPVTFSPSRLPLPPPEFGFGVSDDRRLIGHRRAS